MDGWICRCSISEARGGVLGQKYLQYKNRNCSSLYSGKYHSQLALVELAADEAGVSQAVGTNQLRGRKRVTRNNDGFVLASTCVGVGVWKYSFGRRMSARETTNEEHEDKTTPGHLFDSIAVLLYESEDSS